jgi:hypothetical protein
MPKRISNAVHQKQKMRYNARSRKFAFNSHESWSEKHVNMVLSHSIPDSALCKKIGRSIQAIQLCRVRRGGIYV